MTEFRSRERGVAAEQVQRTMRDSLRLIAREAAGEHLLPDGSRVCTAMWLDLKRASYTIVRNGKSAPLLERPRGIGPRRENHREVAVGRLFELAGGNVELLKTLSRISNTNAMAGIHAAMRSPNSPIRLSDGTPGRMVGRGHSSFEIRSDGNGGLRVRCD